MVLCLGERVFDCNRIQIFDLPDCTEMLTSMMTELLWKQQ